MKQSVETEHERNSITNNEYINKQKIITINSRIIKKKKNYVFQRNEEVFVIYSKINLKTNEIVNAVQNG